MHIHYSYCPQGPYIGKDLQRLIDFFEDLGVDSLTNLEIRCYPWRKGKRLQAVNEEGKIRPFTITLQPGDERYEPLPPNVHYEPITIRERPDEFDDVGLAAILGWDD